MQFVYCFISSNIFIARKHISITLVYVVSAATVNCTFRDSSKNQEKTNSHLCL